MAPSNAEQAPRVGDGEIVFGYWNIRGLGQAIRYVLEYAELQFDERRYSFGEQMNSREEWLKVRLHWEISIRNKLLDFILFHFLNPEYLWMNWLLEIFREWI